MTFRSPLTPARIRPSALALSLLLILLISCQAAVVEHSPTSTIELAHATPLPASPTPSPPPLLPTNPPSPPPPTEPAPAASAVAHTVQPGDTLLGLAMQYDVPMAAIQLQNDLGNSTVVQAGQSLIIPPPAGWEGASRFWIVHVVQAGETLLHIARRYGLEASEIQAVNGLTHADLLTVGQELVLPLDKPVDASTVARAVQPTATPLPPPNPTSAPPTVQTLVQTAALTPSIEATATPIPTSPPLTDADGWRREIARLINEARAQHGLPPLAYNPTLASIAQAHAEDCLQRGWGSHTGSDGSNVRSRMLHAGYTPLRWSECWAHTQSPQDAMHIWMDETPPNDPHRRTILNPALTEIGVGVVQPAWGYYFFADFGTPR